MKLYLSLIVLLPLLGFLFNGLLRNFISKAIITIVGSGVILASFILSVLVFLDVKNGGSATISYFNFIPVDKFNIPFNFKIDQLSSLFLLIITGIGFLIHLYSSAYMHEEKPNHFARFFAYLNLFVFSMLLLVLGGNYVIMFIGWEGVGLCSYLLIGFWFKNNDYNYAARKAFVMNRIGDLGFLMAVFWLLAKLNTVNYDEVLTAQSLAQLSSFDITMICSFLFVGAMGKSAQIPLYTWLPDAMAGPTPVSALIHAATMVTAGIYMITRSNILFSNAEVVQHAIAVVGIATVLLSATIAIKQNDIKKVLAYSTVSQLGYMFLGLGVGAYTGAVFHVMTHAFFKACLFLGAGSVIHALHHEQDMRNMGGLKNKLPVTHITFLLACLAIAGIPPFSGFFSKDEILAAAYSSNPVYYYLGIAGAAMTAFYMFRLYATTFLGSYRGKNESHIHESPASITIPLIVLALLSVAGGFLNVPEVLHGNHALQNYLAPVIAENPNHEAHHLSHTTEYVLMGISVAIALAALLIATAKYKNKPELGEPQGFGKVLANKWYVDEIYNAIIVKPILGIASFFKNIVEKSGIDGIVNGVGKLVQSSSRQLRLLQNGQISSYILIMVIAVVVLILLVFKKLWI